MKVRVFRNLTRGVWSIQTRTAGAWRTIAHAPQASLSGASFYVSEASRVRCAAAGKREVHAWVEGDLVAVHGAKLVAKWTTPEIESAMAERATGALVSLADRVTYSPFTRGDFHKRGTGESVATAERVTFTMGEGCSV